MNGIPIPSFPLLKLWCWFHSCTVAIFVPSRKKQEKKSKAQINWPKKSCKKAKFDADVACFFETCC